MFLRASPFHPGFSVLDSTMQQTLVAIEESGPLTNDYFAANWCSWPGGKGAPGWPYYGTHWQAYDDGASPAGESTMFLGAAHLLRSTQFL